MMTTTKHTPGPWNVHSCEMHPHHEIIAECGRRIATQNDHHDGQDKANARLIAASPDLLDALTDLVGGGGKEGDLFSSEAMEKAREAIAQARGEG